ncbi:MAG: hypothetical protein H6914_09795 [Novosphingobium sp.]|nr:hypothetical protein [Novosphingobium sp.]
MSGPTADKGFDDAEGALLDVERVREYRRRLSEAYNTEQLLVVEDEASVVRRQRKAFAHQIYQRLKTVSPCAVAITQGRAALQIRVVRRRLRASLKVLIEDRRLSEKQALKGHELAVEKGNLTFELADPGVECVGHPQTSIIPNNPNGTPVDEATHRLSGDAK